MFISTNKTHGKAAIMAAAATLVAMGLGARVAKANYIWDPSSVSGGSDGNGTWYGAGLGANNWYNGSTETTWANSNTAVFGRGNTSAFTVTLGSSTNSASGLILGFDGNYTLAANGTNNALAVTGQVILKRNTSSGNAGTLTLQGVTVNNSTYNGGSDSLDSGVYDNGTLNIGNSTASAVLEVQNIVAGGGSGITNSTAGSLGTININQGSTLAISGNSRLQIDYGEAPANGTGGAVNVNGGTVTLGSTGIIWLSDVSVSGGGTTSVGTMNVGQTGSGSYVSASEAETANNGFTQTGVLNVYSGTVKLTGSTSINTAAGSTTNVNVSGGTLTASGTVNSGGSGAYTDLTVSGTGIVTANEITSSSGATTGVNVSGGSLSTSVISSSGTTNVTVSGTGTLTATSTGGSITSGSGGKTTINLNGGTLSVYNISANGGSGGSTTLTFNGGTLQENGGSSFSKGIISNANGANPTLYVDSGGATIDNNSATAFVYVPLLTGTTSGGGLTIANSGSGGEVGLEGGGNTYTGATVVEGNATLSLIYSSTLGSASTIANSSLLQIDAGGTLNIVPDSAGQQISVAGGLTLEGGTIDVLLATPVATTELQNIQATVAATISGNNIINVSASGANALVPGTYTLISDTAGGLIPGDFILASNTVTLNSITYDLSLTGSATTEMLTVSNVPEPATLGILALGGLGLLLAKRRLMAVQGR